MSDLPDDPDFSEYLESDNSNFQFMGRLLNTFHTEMLDRWNDMPDLQVFSNREYHLELRIAPLYKQTYLATLVGFDRASLILQGVLMEQMLKDLYYVQNGKEIEEEISNPGLADALEECKDSISERAYRFVDEYRDKVRNNWIHDNNKNIADDIKLPAREVTLSDSEEATEKIAEASQKPLTEMMGYEDQRFIGDLIMAKLDERALEYFLSTDEVVREISEKIMGETEEG